MSSTWFPHGGLLILLPLVWSSVNFKTKGSLHPQHSPSHSYSQSLLPWVFYQERTCFCFPRGSVAPLNWKIAWTILEAVRVFWVGGSRVVQWKEPWDSGQDRGDGVPPPPDLPCLGLPVLLYEMRARGSRFFPKCVQQDTSPIDAMPVWSWGQCLAKKYIYWEMWLLNPLLDDEQNSVY